MSLTEVVEGLLNLFGGEVYARVGRDERRVDPVVVLIAVHAICPQPVDWQLLLQQADNLHLRELCAVTNI